MVMIPNEEPLYRNEEEREHARWLRRVRWTNLAIPTVLIGLIIYRLIAPAPKQEPVLDDLAP